MRCSVVPRVTKRDTLSSVAAAGGTWTSRTTSAPWAARCWHTSVVDAAGAIYVVGGSKGHSAYNDVWATDGGARPDSRGVLGGYSRGYYRGTRGSRGMLGLHSGVLLRVVW